MPNTRAPRLYLIPIVAALAASLPAAAHAQDQFRPQPLTEPAPAEQFVVEGSASLWFPSADMSITSESLGIPGTLIDFTTDLGLENQRFAQLKLVLKPSRRNKIRVELIPIKYEQTSTPTRDIIFNGIRYRIGVPVSSSLDWKAYRFAYEYDFLSQNRWFVGLVVEAKYTDVQATLSATIAGIGDTEFTHARAPIPAVGGIARFYIAPAISVTGEFTGFKLPLIQDKYEGHYADFDIYGTVNATRNIGAQVGFRALDVGYLVTTDSGAFTVKGLYFGLVLRY